MFPRGKIFFLEDLTDMNDAWSVRFYLSPLVEEGFILRLARGIYCYPRLEGEFGIRVVVPDPETIAYALAARANVRIIPYGDRAAQRLGLAGFSTSYRYLTDGAPRIINLANGRKIYFNHTSEMRIFAFKSEMMQFLCLAIRYLGKDAMKDETSRRIVREVLGEIPEKTFDEDFNLMPAWVGELLLELREGN